MSQNQTLVQGRCLPFKSELLLVDALIEFIHRTKLEKFETLKEFEGGFGRPDLLLFSEPVPNADMDIKSLALLNSRLAPLLSLKASRTIKSIQALAAASGASNRAARQMASELARVNRLKQSNSLDDGFKISPVNRPPFTTVVAIEAKLRDWRRALTQAFRYREFSTEAWVVLDHAFAASALKQLSRFKATGVGLASFSTTGELHVHVLAKRQKWSNSALAWRTQAMLAKAVTQA